MDKEKLNKAAGEDWCNNVLERDLKPITKSAFKRGANWLMQQPLSERLTDEEKDRIRGLLNYAGENAHDSEVRAMRDELTDIFGKDLFNDK